MTLNCQNRKGIKESYLNCRCEQNRQNRSKLEKIWKKSYPGAKFLSSKTRKL